MVFFLLLVENIFRTCILYLPKTELRETLDALCTKRSDQRYRKHRACIERKEHSVRRIRSIRFLSRVQSVYLPARFCRDLLMHIRDSDTLSGTVKLRPSATGIQATDEPHEKTHPFRNTRLYEGVFKWALLGESDIVKGHVSCL